MSGVSVATIKSPEFINITSISPLISKCEIKVLYVGANRNMSFITKEVATEMAQTLPGTPIVGYYSEDKEDFRDHGDQMIFDGDGIKFNCLTKPYGFVDINTRVWFQEFEDTDDFGNKVLREYLMCEGYLWTEQYKEAQKVINEGRPHSMELDEKTLKGHWSTDNNRGLDFFIINDAIFSKLCILGEDVEPCFEGSSVTAPEVSSSFTLKADEFTTTLFTMMKELKELTYSLQNKGGSSMDNLNNEIQNPADDFVAANPSADPAPVVEAATAPAEPEPTPAPEETPAEPEVTPAEPELDEVPAEEGNPEEDTEFAKSKEDDKKDPDDSDSNDDEEEEDDKEKKDPTKNTLDEDKYALLEQQFNELNKKYASLEAENAELKAFKLAIEDKEKDELINSFYMLSDEDKKNVIENKSQFTLDEIEKELSVICVRKRVSFDNTQESEQKPPFTYNLNETSGDDLPAWLKAVEAHKKND